MADKSYICPSTLITNLGSYNSLLEGYNIWPNTRRIETGGINIENSRYVGRYLGR